MNYLKNATILVIDDEVDNLFIINEFFSELCHQIILQTNPLVGIELAAKKTVNIILLDILMPEIDGYETCRRLKANPETQPIPVIFLSSLMRTSDKVKGFEAGAVDYITKPFEVEEMIVRIESCLKISYQLQRQQPYSFNRDKLNSYSLNQNEMDIIQLYIEGHSRKTISQQLGMNAHSVKWHLGNLFKKMDIKSRADLLLRLK